MSQKKCNLRTTAAARAELKISSKKTKELTVKQFAYLGDTVVVGGAAVQDVKTTDQENKWDLHRIAPIVEEQNYTDED